MVLSRGCWKLQQIENGQYQPGVPETLPNLGMLSLQAKLKESGEAGLHPLPSLSH